VADWKIITDVEDGRTKATYGTDWYYVEAGTNINGIGELKTSYIMNYKEGKAVRFNGTRHTMLSSDGGVAVKDCLVFNLDPASIEGISIDEWGENVVLNGFDNINASFTPTSFIFDGIDDYITMPYNVKNNIKKGLTYEFFGKLKPENSNHKIGIFQIGEKDEEGEEAKCGEVRFCFSNNFDDRVGNIMWNASNEGKNDTTAFFAPEGVSWNHICNLENYSSQILYGEDFYLTITINPISNLESIYLNGQLLAEGIGNQQAWDDFIEKDELKLETITLGRACYSDGDYGREFYSNNETYSLRFYNRALTANEVLANYNATVAYHNILLNGGNAGTGGATGGEDIGNIE